MQDAIKQLTDYLRGTLVGRVIVLAALINVVAGLWMAWVLGSPLFLDTVVEDEFEAVVVTPAGCTSAADMIMAGEEFVSCGEFTDEPYAYTGEGQALIYTLADGSRELRLQNFSVSNGPGLDVVLSSVAAPANTSASLGEFIALADLRGNRGNQSYPIPANVNLSQYKSVIIYCVPFRRIFIAATLES